MDAQHLNTYLNLIETLLHCPKGEEWSLLQQHEDLINPELLTVMEQVANQLNTDGNTSAAQFLHNWMIQLNHLLQQNTTSETPEANRSESYLNLIQTLLRCSKGDEVAILSQHPELVDEGLVYTMNQVAAQLAAKGNQDIAIYLKHLAAEVNRVWLHPGTGRSAAPTSISSPPPASYINTPPTTGLAMANKLHPGEGRSVTAAPTPISPPLPNSPLQAPANTGMVTGNKLPFDEGRVAPIPPTPEVATANNLHPEEGRSVAAAPTPISSPPLDKPINELWEKISSRLEKMEGLLNKQLTAPNPLWYMPILEQVNAQAWIISSEEVEQLIGIKPHCDPGHNSFVRGCWKFVKMGKVGTHSSWRVIKEMTTLPSDSAPAPEHTELELESDLSSPWSENS